MKKKRWPMNKGTFVYRAGYSRGARIDMKSGQVVGYSFKQQRVKDIQ